MPTARDSATTYAGHMKRILFSITLAALATSSVASAGAAPLPRANVVLPSALSVDLVANTVTLPLHRGTAKGAPVWYIVTDASDAAAAKKLGVLYSPLLVNAVAAAQKTTGSITALVYTGTVNFAPVRSLTVDAVGNPTGAKPGSVGDAQYSPLVQVGSIIYNAPIVASGVDPHDVDQHSDTLDRVVAIDTSNIAHATVTLVLARGFTNGQPIAYISTDASEEAPAAIERSTYAPRLKGIAAGSIPIDVFFNGQNQGIPFAAREGKLTATATASNAAALGSPLNIQSTFPAYNYAPSGYSPLWSVFPAIWTKAAIAADKDTVQKSSNSVQQAVTAGLVTGPEGKAFGAAGIIVNCPVVAYAVKRP